MAKRCDKPEVYDYVIVGAGNAGCVLANRLSENGRNTVCILDAGRDDARLPELLPVASPAPVPQPGDFHWGQYVRGAPVPYEFPGTLISRGFGHFDWFETEDENGPIPGRSTTYARHVGWGGCTAHNFTFSIRNAPYNWQQWVDLGLTEWDASLPSSTLIKFYKKVENRSQRFPLLFFDPAKFNVGNPLGPQPQSSFPPNLPNVPQYYGFNGQVPLCNFFEEFAGVNDFTPVMKAAVGQLDPAYGYPLEAPGVAQLVDLDWPPAASLGGLSFNNFAQTFQFGSLTPPPKYFGMPQVDTPYIEYAKKSFPNEPIFQYPPELANVGPVELAPNGWSGPVPLTRVSATTAYLYPALAHKNLTIKSEVLVTKVIVCKKKARGVKYLEGYNIYATGRNTSATLAGYGGSDGDARYNAVFAKKEGEKRVMAKKEVILCAGVFNDPQILQLSGIGDRALLEPLGIRVKHHLPGVGEHLIDNHELFFYWLGKNPNNVWTLAAKSSTSEPHPDFDLSFGLLSAFANESRDATVQNRWVGTKNIPAIYQSHVRNEIDNILVRTNVNPVDPADVPFVPIMVPFADTNALLIEQEEFNLTEGYVRVVSKDPTEPPKLVFNYLQDERDLKRWIDVCINTVFPLMLNIKNVDPTFFSDLLDPAPVDFLKPGVTYANWTSVDQVDLDRFTHFLYKRVGGHHAGGTCKMGLIDRDPMSVVDQSGRVYGIKHLRVCDNSIVPVSIRWPNITLYVIAEKIAADILHH